VRADRQESEPGREVLGSSDFHARSRCLTVIVRSDLATRPRSGNYLSSTRTLVISSPRVNTIGMASEPSEITRLKYRFRHKLFVTAPIVIAGSAWAIANATTWWGGLIFGLGALLLVLLGVMVAGGAAAHANAEEQAAAVGPEAPDDSAATG
jgi:hypothetical protein